MTFEMNKFKTVGTKKTTKKGGFTITKTTNGCRIGLNRQMGKDLELFEPEAEKSEKELQFFLSDDMLAIGVDIVEDAPSFKVSGSDAKPLVYSSELANEILAVAEMKVANNKTISFPDWKKDEMEGKPIILVALK